MLNKRHFRLLAAALAVLTLVVAACGSDNDGGVTTGGVPQVDDIGGGLPLADNDSDTPAVLGTCLPDEPDCEDILVDDPKSQELPETTEDGADLTNDATTSGMTVDGGLTIAEALTTDAAGTIAVHGYLFDDGTGLQLCETLIALGERYGCDGGSIAVTNLDPTEVADVVFFEGITYAEHEITLFGALNESILVVDSLVAG